MDKSQLYVFAQPVYNIQSIEQKLDAMCATEAELKTQFTNLLNQFTKQKEICDSQVQEVQP